MKKSSTLFVIAVVLMVCFSAVCKAQTAQNNAQLMYLQVDDITVEKYNALQSLLKTNEAYAVKEVCIPAHVMSVKIMQGQDMLYAFAEFKALMATVNINTVSHRTDYNDQLFLQKCQSARSVN